MGDAQHRPGEEALLDIQLWSDVVCPWCWIGEARLRLALQEAGLASRTRITMRAFQLDPGARREPTVEMLARKFGRTPAQVKEMTGQVTALGAELGLEMHHEDAISCDTGLAHQAIQFARTTGHDVELISRLHRAHFTDGADLSDRAVLVHAAGDVGLDEHLVEAALDTGAYAQGVIADRQEAERIGVRGVPFFVFERRFALSGAQPVEAMVMAIEPAVAPPA
ncbi:MAG: DsbA family oxidoreductase [Solirubrobacteraceae bacterium]|nr:DsbA family oxidoreductase [Solirubrobacteraceae bacterium]